MEELYDFLLQDSFSEDVDEEFVDKRKIRKLYVAS